MGQILAVGIATVDIVNEVDGYPAEDDAIRALASRSVRGGNATNTLTVLAQLGHQCAWAGTLADDNQAAIVRNALERQAIRFVGRVCPGSATPTSYINLNRRNGSRTIVHYRDLPEYSADDFRALDLNDYDWLHFEGREVDTLRVCIDHARAQRPELPISIELEKPRDNIQRLIPLADLLLCSRHYAESQGHESAESLLHALPELLPGAVATCAWGSDGAWARDTAGPIIHAPAMVLDKVVDSIGAGDTFNAAMIDARLRGLALTESLAMGCATAGHACTREGLEALW